MSSDREFEERKKVLEELKKFNRTEQETLYKILKEKNENMSENKNGIFFDLMNLKDESIEEIKKLVEFSKKNRTVFETREKEMNNLTAELVGGPTAVEIR